MDLLGDETVGLRLLDPEDPELADPRRLGRDRPDLATEMHRSPLGLGRGRSGGGRRAS